MKILIMGGNGMMGHALFLNLKTKHHVAVTLRNPLSSYNYKDMFDPQNCYEKVDAHVFETVNSAIKDFMPEVVVNCLGIVKQRDTANDYIQSIEINSLFPHKLALACSDIKARVIHLSTDCVFLGEKGDYDEADNPDARDLYGLSKYLGELKTYKHCFTIRSSIIGYELERFTGLLEWFMAQEGKVRGFANGVFSGFTTYEMSRIIENIIVKHKNAFGLYHVSSDPINKYDLLCMIKKVIGLSTRVDPDYEFKCDRSLNSNIFRNEFHYVPPSWAEMITELNKLSPEYKGYYDY